MDISVIGGGYVGVITAISLAQMYDHKVIVVEPDEEKLAHLQRGLMPFHEPYSEPVLQSMVYRSRLMFVPALTSQFGTIQIIAVGTPAKQDGSTDLTQVFDAATTIARLMDQDTIIAIKSTVPVGTCEKIEQLISHILIERGVVYMWEVISNPEFLSQGRAMADARSPDRIIIGANTSFGRLYGKVFQHSSAIEYVSQKAGEMIKYMSNAILATKISIMNEAAAFAEHHGIDIMEVVDGVGRDERIGMSHLTPGIGYGGSCLPKDVSSLLHQGREANTPFTVLETVSAINNDQHSQLCKKVIRRFGDDLVNLRVGIWGVSFKRDTDDMRNAKSIPIIKFLLERGATVVLHDPKAVFTCMDIMDTVLSAEQVNRLSFNMDKMVVATNVDALLLLSDWEEYDNIDTMRLLGIMKQPCLFDGRNFWQRDYMIQEGFEYHAIGR
jgi:UDPglucose 6-dehydrogenase